MKRILLTTAILSVAGAGAALASERCSAPMSEWQPREALQKKLEAEGWKVHRVKTDDGCYEVRGTNEKGAHLEALFNPKTFEAVTMEDDD